MSPTLAAVLAVAVVLTLLLVPRLLGGGKMPSSAAVEKLEAGAVVLDVRRADEVARGAYPGALHIPLAELQSRLNEVPRGRHGVAYGAAGVRAASAVRILKRAGFPDVIDGGGLGDLPSR